MKTCKYCGYVMNEFANACPDCGIVCVEIDDDLEAEKLDCGTRGVHV